MHIDLARMNQERILAKCGRAGMSAVQVVNLMLAAASTEQLIAIVKCSRDARAGSPAGKSVGRRRLRIVIG